MILVYLLITEFLIYFLQTEQIFKKLVGKTNWHFLSELWYCQKCLGFWIACWTQLIFNINLLDGLIPQFKNIMIYNYNIDTNLIIYNISYLISAAITTYILYYVRAGIEINHINITVGE